LFIIVCLCALFPGGCANDAAKENRAGFELADQQRGKIGAEDFMPEQVRVVFNRSCTSCHAPDGGGIAAIAPALNRAKHRSAEEWDRYLRASRHAHPVGHAPPLWLDGDEMKAMAAYLDALTQRNR
jgi:mono/diheme cytochrome c family protein